MCIGGPALIYYVTPTEEELFMRYNPELQRRSLERRKEKQEDFDQFVGRLKQYSKSDKPGKHRPSSLILKTYFVSRNPDQSPPRVLQRLILTLGLTVWTAWEEDAARRRQLGVQAELDRRRSEAEEAEARKQEMQNSLR